MTTFCFDGKGKPEENEEVLKQAQFAVSDKTDELKYYASQNQCKASDLEKAVFADLAGACKDYLAAYEYYKNRI